MANYVFGGTIKLGGAQQFKNAVSQCSESLRRMSSTLRSQTSEFLANDNSMRKSVAGQRALNSAIHSQELELSKAKGLLASYSTEITKQTQNHNILNKEYKSAVLELNKLEKTLGTSSNEYKKQSQVVNQLGTQLSQSQVKLNDNKESYSRLKKEINNANNTINQSKTSMDQLGKEEDSLKTKTDKVSDGFTVFKGILANLGSRAIMSAVNGIRTLSNSVVNLGKQAVTSWSEYEQLIGGVETLFTKKTAPMVEEFANKAYKTVGVSANKYMDQVLKFSASMLQSVGGDTKKAAQLSDMAMIDMADNANKLGNEMELIENAYQGFAKHNYLMLDNLRLGYGGTKNEMKRLLADAKALTGIDYKLDDLGDMVQAIHVIQTNIGMSGYSVEQLTQKLSTMSLTEKEVAKVASSMGISYDDAMQRMKSGTLTVADAQVLLGTTAWEAEHTIEGSSKAMKASWQNLITGLAKDNVDFTELFKQFEDGITTFAKNIGPRIKIAVQGVARLLITLLKDFGPSLINGAVDLIKDIVNTLSDSMPQIVEGLKASVTSIVNGIAQIAPKLNKIFTQLLLGLLESLVQNLPSILDTFIKSSIESLKAIAESLPNLIPMIVASIMDMIGVLLDNMDAIIDVGMQIITGLIDGIIKALPILIDKLPEIIDKIISVLVENIPKILFQVAALILKIAEAFVKATPAILAAQWKMWAAVGANILQLIPTWLEYGKQFAMNLWNGIVSRIKSFPEAAKKGLNQFIDGLKSGFNKLWDAGIEMINRLINGAISYFNDLWDLGARVVNLIIDALSPLANAVWNIGSDIVRGLWNGISDAGGWLWRKVSNFASGIIDSMMSALGIHSPSTVAKEKVGKNVIYGVGDGIVENSEYVTKQLQAAIKGAVIDVVPENISTKLNVDANAPKMQNQMLNNEYSEFASANLIRDFKSALSEMKIVLDDEVAGKFVTNTVANAIYS